MLSSVKELFGYRIMAKDGNIGEAEDFLFDDRTWILRYVVVASGLSRPDRIVLLIPSILKQPEWRTHIIPVELTKEKVENSPEMDRHKPLSRRYEIELHEHFGWERYWHSGTQPWSRLARSDPLSLEKRKEPREDGENQDPNLRSTKEAMGCRIQAYDGEIGHVDEFIASDKNWRLYYVVVDTRNWLPGRKVIISPGWIQAINWPEKKVHVELNRELIKNSPKYDPTFPINREYEERLYDYYGRPRYWDE